MLDVASIDYAIVNNFTHVQRAAGWQDTQQHYSRKFGIVDS
jgi:hypothetical protein